MAGNGKEAMRFVNGLLDRVKEPFFREMESLRQVKARLTENKEVSLHPWDTVYYANLQAEERFRLDREELRHYFPLPRVMAGLFGVAEQLYGIRVTELPVRKPLTGISGPEKGGEAEVWNPDVRFLPLTTARKNGWGIFTWIFSPAATSGPERGCHRWMQAPRLRAASPANRAWE